MTCEEDFHGSSSRFLCPLCPRSVSGSYHFSLRLQPSPPKTGHCSLHGPQESSSHHLHRMGSHVLGTRGLEGHLTWRASSPAHPLAPSSPSTRLSPTWCSELSLHVTCLGGLPGRPLRLCSWRTVSCMNHLIPSRDRELREGRGACLSWGSPWPDKCLTHSRCSVSALNGCSRPGLLSARRVRRIGPNDPVVQGPRIGPSF